MRNKNWRANIKLTPPMHITEFKQGQRIVQTSEKKPFNALYGQVLEYVTIYRREIVLKKQEANNYTMIHLPFKKWQDGWELKK